MSFLNPINEPVLRFKSTDAGAPQINYGARVAGDVKAVLKACLVTGYGAVASAGWSIVNEVDHVAEFVSPSAAMSDYRLGIDDTSTSSTTWYYQYNNAKVNLSGGALTKSNAGINTVSSLNSWDLIVTGQGIYLIQNVVMSVISAIVSSITYWGRMKSAAVESTTNNICWWCLGYNSSSGSTGRTPDFFSALPNSVGKHYSLGGLDIDGYAHPAIEILKIYDTGTLAKKISNIDVSAEWFLIANRNIIAQQPGVLLRAKNDVATLSTTGISTFNNRPVLTVWVSRTSTVADQLYAGGTLDVLIYLDYWEF